ncbi:hypothetical protein J6590_043092 [Homalodisca vitripennis]|nr:hypothetical protein J6590_043092 [Homalodisca vitripennis]
MAMQKMDLGPDWRCNKVNSPYRSVIHTNSNKTVKIAGQGIPGAGGRATSVLCEPSRVADSELSSGVLTDIVIDTVIVIVSTAVVTVTVAFTPSVGSQQDSNNNNTKHPFYWWYLRHCRQSGSTLRGGSGRVASRASSRCRGSHPAERVTSPYYDVNHPCTQVVTHSFIHSGGFGLFGRGSRRKHVLLLVARNESNSWNSAPRAVVFPEFACYVLLYNAPTSCTSPSG